MPAMKRPGMPGYMCSVFITYRGNNESGDVTVCNIIHTTVSNDVTHHSTLTPELSSF